MARLVRVLFAGLGTDSARFNPVTLDFRDGKGDPGHAVMWLRNGGGKTTMLSFLYSTLRPHHLDWLGRHNGRQTELTEYVKDKQTGFVLLEFAFPALGGVRRVVGQAICKRASRPKRVFFTFRTDGDLSWQEIPVMGTGASEPAGSAEIFEDRMKVLSQGREAAVQFYRTEIQSDWRDHLDSIGLDPEIYRSHLIMNADEGGLLNFFDFPSPDSFLEKLLDMAYEPLRPTDGEAENQKEEGEDVAAVIEKFRLKVFAKPDLEATALWCQHVITALEMLQTEFAVVQQFRLQRESYMGRAGRMLRSVLGHINNLDDVVGTLEKEEKICRDAKLAATRNADQHRKFQKSYERRRRLIAIDEAEAAVSAADTGLHQEEGWLRALQTAQRRRRIEEADKLIEQYRLLKASLEQAFAPDRAELEAVGRSLYDLLQVRIEDAEIKRQAALGTKRAAEATVEKLNKELLEITKQAGAAGQSLQTARDFLNDIDQERRKLREQGFLLPPSETGGAALQRWDGVARDETTRSNRLEAAIKVTKERIATLQTQLGERQTEDGKTGQRIASLETWLASAAARAAKIQGLPALRREAGDEAAFDPYNPALDTALASRAAESQRVLLLEAVAGAADERVVKYSQAHPQTTFPPPAGIEQLLQRLREAGAPSTITAYHWLSVNCEAGEAARRLRIQPALYAGLIVQVPAELSAARRVLSQEGLDLPVFIGSPSDLASLTEEQGHVILPEEKGFFSTKIAQINLPRIVARAGEREKECVRLREENELALTTLANLRDFWRDYPKEIVGQKDKDLETQRQARLGLQQAIAELKQEAAGLELDVGQKETERRTADKAAGEARQKSSRVQAFVQTHESKAEGTREEERRLIADVQGYRDSENGLQQQLTDLADGAGQRDQQILDETLRKQQFLTRQQALPAGYVGARGSPTQEDLDTLEAMFAVKRRDYEKNVQASYYDAKIEEEQKRRTDLESEALKESDPPAEEDILLALEEADLGRAIEVQSQDTQTTRNALGSARRDLEKTRAERPPALAQSERETFGEWGAPKSSQQAAEFGRRAEEVADQQVKLAAEADEALALVSEKVNVTKLQRASYESLPARLRKMAGSEEAEHEAGFQGQALPDTALVDTLEANFEACRDDLDAAQEKAKKIFDDRYMAAYRLRELEGREIDLIVRMSRLARTQVEERAGHWLAEIRTHYKVVADELGLFERDRFTVLQLMNGCVKDAEAVLRAAQARSMMPDSMGAWAGRSFLTIVIPKKNDEVERLSNLGRMLADWIDQENPKPVPTGSKLAYHCLVAVAGRGQIDVKILKPEYNLRPFQHDIVKLKSFSGGEQVTAAIVLYCIIVKLRAQRRGRATSLKEDSGFLLLDNPLGKANLPDFVDLQVSMAERLGVQYICGTGINDFEALAGFPKIIRLRNSSINPRTGASLVEVESGMLSAVVLGTNPNGTTAS